MKKYKRYKDSGIEWLGKIPKSWSSTRIKNNGFVNGRVGWKALKASEYVEAGFFFLSTPNIKDVQIDFENVNYITRERYDESPELKLKSGDILLVKDGSTLGIVNVVRNLPAEGTVNSSIAVLRLKKFNCVYIYYFLLSNYIQNIIQLKKEGMGVPHLFQRDINNFEVAKPPFSEQTTIALFLENKTQAIDKKIALLEQKIIYYKELRKSLINETVTKGLDKNVKLKDSGIAWIGQIPEHWEVKRFKSFGRTIKGKNLEISDSKFEKSLPLLSLEYLRNKDVKFDTYCYSPDKTLIANGNDLIIVWDGAAVGEIIKAKVGYISSTIAKIDLDKRILDLRYFYFLKDNIDYTLKSVPTGMGIPHLNPSLLNNYPCPVPPLAEQITIAEYLEEKIGLIEKILINIHSQIAKLKELRKTLINDVVTGKIKVTTDEEETEKRFLSSTVKLSSGDHPMAEKSNTEK